jgi:septal ring factor EnvC (AmiA/AmiB activator)
METKWLGRLLLALCFCSPLLAQDTVPTGSNPGDMLSQSISDLMTLQSEMESLNESILKLNNELATSQGELSLLKASLFAYQSRADQLLKRSKELLRICADFKKSSDFNRLVWWVGIPVALVGGLTIGYYAWGR